ncbi:MAG: twin-arginine translocase subunit TatC [Bacteroidales bacterium]|nr:twin-arginine translocase subunit TatC [Bacteroidales bacterium]
MAFRKSEDESEDVQMTFGEHLDELRKVLMHIGIAFVLLFIALFTFFKGDIINIVFYPSESDFITNRLFAKLAELTGTEALKINANPLNLYNNKIAGQFMLHIKASAVGALVIAFPYIIGQLWGFVKPALSLTMKRRTRLIIWKIMFWFFLGVAFSYFIIAPLGINFLANYEANGSIQNIIDVSSYISTVLGVCLAAGLVFQLPLLIRLLASIGIITSAWLRKNRKIAIVVILALSALITPPDIISQLLIFVPFYILYEYGIRIAKNIEKQNADR